MGLIEFLLWTLGFFFLMALIFAGAITYHILVYKYKIRVWRNVGGSWHEDKKIYRARELIVNGSIGEKVLWCPKIKEFISAYGKLSGKNLYYYALGADGYLYNIGIADIDARTGMLDVEMVDRDVRGFHTSNQKNIQERFTKAKNLPMILMTFSVILALLIVFGGGYFLYDKIREINDATAGNLEASRASTEVSKELLVSANTLMDTYGDLLHEIRKEKAGLVPTNESDG